MQATISGQHVEINNNLRKYARRKLTRIDRHFGPVMRSHVVLHVAKNRYQIETTVHTKGSQWHATAEDYDIYIAIDRVVDKLSRQTIKHMEKVVDHQEEGELKNRPNT